MKEFTIRNSRKWVKVMYTKEKYTFAIGYTGEVCAYKIPTYPRDNLLISDIKELAKEFLHNHSN